MRLPLSLPLICLAVLAAGCRTQTVEAPTASKVSQQSTPVPTSYHVLTGNLTGIPAGAEVELALLEVNARSRPSRLLSDTQVQVQDAETPFQLAFDPANFPSDQRVELRGRVVKSGQLIMRLPARTITLASNQSVGQWQAVPAP